MSAIFDPDPWLGRLIGILLIVIITLPVQAFNIYKLGGEDGNSWKTAQSFEPGNYTVLNALGTPVDTRPVTSNRTYATWQDTLSEVTDSTGGQWLHPLFLPPDLNLAQHQARTRIARGFNNNLATSSCLNNTQFVEPMFDGDPTTASFFNVSTQANSGITSLLYVQNTILDLGVDYPINRVRFYPRLGTSNPRIDELLDIMGTPRLAKEDLPKEDFTENFLSWFEVSAAHSFHDFATHCSLQTPQNPWFAYIQYWRKDPPNDPRFITLRKAPESLDVIVDIRFPTQQFQWVAIRPIDPINNWEIAEFEIYGEGFVQRAVYTTAVLDFGGPVVWGKIRWDGDFNDGSDVIIRTRSGKTPDPNLYWRPSVIDGELTRLSRVEFERANISKRLTSLDRDNWSFWSAPYPLDSGQRNPDLDATAWQDGTAILSPAPSRYLQIQVIFQSSLTQAGRLRELEIQFAAPAALQVIGEIWPQDVSHSEATTFTYSVLPTFEAGNTGFNRLEIFTLTRAEAVHSVRVDAAELTNDFTVDILDDRIVVSLPWLEGADDTFKLIEVEFDVHVVRYGTQFQGWVFDSESNGVKQLINPGDANIDFPGNSLGVRTDKLGANPVTQVQIAPNPFTPNGDGINEVAQFRFQLHNVSVQRQLTIDLYDLAGQRVRQLEKKRVIRGLFDQGKDVPTWDGRNDQGVLVPPGHYIYCISLDADEASDDQIGTIVVAY